MKKILTMVIIAILCSSMFTILVRAQPPAPDGTADVYLVPSTVTPQLGVPFSVNITVSNVANLWAWQADVQWDPNSLVFDHFTWGDFQALTGGLSIRLSPAVVNNVMTLPALESAVRGETPLSSTAPVALLNITFNVIAAGPSTVSLTDLVLRGQDPTTTTPYLPWSDVTGPSGVPDGKVDMRDIVSVVRGYLNIPPINPLADVNNDGTIDITDIAIVTSDFAKIVSGLDWEVTKTILDITPLINTNTPANVGAMSVIIAGDLTLTFASVTSSGTTEATTSTTGPAPPAGFYLGAPNPGLYYQITTTATYAAPIQICITYDPTQFPNPAALTLMHWEAGAWQDVTIPPIDAINHIICGEVSSLSIFAVMEPIPRANIDIDPLALNLKSKGNWITAYIELPAGLDVHNINVPTILLKNTIAVAPSAPATIGDHDTDGIPDLMVKFDRAAVAQYILDNVDFDKGSMAIKLTITGNLNDGTPFSGTNTIKILYKFL